MHQIPSTFTGGYEWGLVFSVICPYFLVFAVLLTIFLMFTVSGKILVSVWSVFFSHSSVNLILPALQKSLIKSLVNFKLRRRLWPGCGLFLRPMRNVFWETRGVLGTNLAPRARHPLASL